MVELSAFGSMTAEVASGDVVGAQLEEADGLLLMQQHCVGLGDYINQSTGVIWVREGCDRLQFI